MPELLQQDARPDRIADAVAAMVQNPARLQTIRRDLVQLRQTLGGAGASRRVAEMALEMLS